MKVTSIHTTQQPIRLYRHNDLEIGYEIVDVAGESYNLTGANEILFVVVWNNNVLFTKTLGAGVTIVDPVAGWVDVRIAATDVNISAGVYSYELLIVDQGGNRLVADRGAFVVKRSLTALQT